MHSLYIHIPFCKQACHYCDFHFSTTLKRKSEMVDSICKELFIRQEEANNPLKAIYLGGGTPSILSIDELKQIFEIINKYYTIASDAEITLEANPDDFFEKKCSGRKFLSELKRLKINRLSIGVQSFFEEDLKWMHRAHNAKQTIELLEETSDFFDNISIDLIYGLPNMSQERWLENLNKVIQYKIPHVSAYALTVEPKTALYQFIVRGKYPDVDENKSHAQFMAMVDFLEKENFIHYELSNFGKMGYFSKNNTAYWEGKKYMGIGPSAHSFNGVERSWNISNNIKYIQQINTGVLPSQREVLSLNDQYNELIMTGIRTQKGISLQAVEQRFGEKMSDYLQKQANKFIQQQLLEISDNCLKTTRNGKFLSDGIASDLFFV
ncbi:radical SAM family heme chaperone HemW [Capnocytophaga canimorsus]|uniref:Heme chaperone HemW n=1 Tax=Capnocytophaga canimorsus (strain 5) TaxID=860228 RepID=F9YSK0_CAPCC|nr:radical SAM family heme chaperone HemW [Capnocytophaga canimorsus]AEK22673.1 Oxygen-independent coproporphyrinogen-III oxidase 1 [Capnocytophaga canimorsus Cc5]